MSEFLKMDIFFFTTTVVVIVLGAIFAFILYRVWKILGRVDHVAQEIESETALLRGDIAQVRSGMRAGSFGFKKMWRFFRNAIINVSEEEKRTHDHKN